MIKKSLMICVLSIILCGWSFSIRADQITTDQTENLLPSPGLKTAGDILWYCDVQHLASPDSDFQIVGIETLRDTIYITGGNNGLDPNRVHVWVRTGSTCQYLYSVNQPAASTGWGWRDLACDGTYLYGSYSNILNCFYATPGGVVAVPANNITVAGLPSGLIIRAVAYDPDSNWFWTADFANSIYAFNRAGTIKRTYTNGRAVYGLAYDNVTPGGPYLWANVQDSCNVYQFNPATGVYTGVVYSGWGDDDPGVSGIAGGLCVLERGASYKGDNVTLLGISQMVAPTPDEMFAMEIYVAPQESLYWKPPYADYAPSGMPDISEMQALWVKDPTGEHTFCGPCAVANCFQWFDSKYNQNAPGIPGDGFDMFPLVRDYLDGLPPFVGPLQDDHDPYNTDHPATAWMYGGTTAPPPTSQPFLPGFQNPPQPMVPWGELVERLAWYLNTDGVKTGYCQHNGTEVHEMYQGIEDWFNSEHFVNGSTISDTLCVNLWQKPTFQLVSGLVEKSEDVILLLGFWWPDSSGQWWRCGGHYVTVAGINSQDFLIAVSDPMFDWAEGGNPGRVLNGLYIPHTPGHAQTAHNDMGNVSHDLYHVVDTPISPGGLWELADYVVSQRPWYCDDLTLQNIPVEFQNVSATRPSGDIPVITEVEYAVQISPWDFRGDVNVPNGDGLVDISDVVFLINYLFKQGSAPVPFIEGDANCDGIVDVGDVVTVINYLFRNGNVPKCCNL
jgi:hypothetical protein